MRRSYSRVGRTTRHLVVPIAMLTAWASAGATGPAERPEIRELLASGPTPALADDLKMFGQFVGDWDIRAETYLESGTRRDTGRVHIGWILYGTALQDVWTTDDPNTPPGYPKKSFGTTIRYFDPSAKVWQVVWVAPVERVVQTFTARETGGEIVLEGRTPKGDPERWIWSNYTPTSFEWRSTESTDQGKTWRVTQRIWGTRQ